jgi:ABC-type branched-subunit amino acid transport system substrate-binding protein
MKTDEMLAIPAIADEPMLEDPNLLPYGPVFGTYSSSAVEYMASNEGLADGTYCSLTTDDAFGEAVEKGFNFAVAELGLKKGVNLRYPAVLQDFTPQISRLKEASCDVVDLGGAGPALTNAAVRAVQLNFDAKWIAGNTLYSNTIAKGPAADYLKKNALFFLTGTEWGDESVAGQKMLEEDLAAIDPKAVPYANSYQTGYLTGITATAVIKKAIDDGDLSRKHLLEIAASLDTVDDFGLAGGAFNYGGKLTTRVPGHLISAFTVDEHAATGLKLKIYNFDAQVAKKYNETQINK